MSLVGPRPALPTEVAKFDQELLERTSVRPGLTGLWQVEARDNPSFSAYRRLDLFYLDNWSITMDIAILLQTMPVVLGRAVRAARRGHGEIFRSAARGDKGEPFSSMSADGHIISLNLEPRLVDDTVY